MGTAGQGQQKEKEHKRKRKNICDFHSWFGIVHEAI
jgi:hypothetical protein